MPALVSLLNIQRLVFNALPSPSSSSFRERVSVCRADFCLSLVLCGSHCVLLACSTPLEWLEWVTWLLAVPALLVLALAAVCVLLFRRRVRDAWAPPSRDGAVRTLLVLGSGGHTPEMLNFVETLPLTSPERDARHGKSDGLSGPYFQPRIYVVGASDLGPNGSENKAIAFEQHIMRRQTVRIRASQTQVKMRLLRTMFLQCIRKHFSA